MFVFLVGAFLHRQSRPRASPSWLRGSYMPKVTDLYKRPEKQQQPLQSPPRNSAATLASSWALAEISPSSPGAKVSCLSTPVLRVRVQRLQPPLHQSAPTRSST